jgi:hypothetical protein
LACIVFVGSAYLAFVNRKHIPLIKNYV